MKTDCSADLNEVLTVAVRENNRSDSNTDSTNMSEYLLVFPNKNKCAHGSQSADRQSSFNAGKSSSAKKET